MSEVIPVPFHTDTLYLIDHQGEPYVPIRPICAALGLKWQRQHKKITSGRLSATVVYKAAVAGDGKTREMLCLPLRKLPDWLYSISPGRVRADIRPKLEQYQEECDEVLWRHWSGLAPAAEAAPRRDETALLYELLDLYRFKVGALEAQLAPAPKRQPPRPLTDDDIEQIRQLAAGGLSNADIARRLGRSTATVSFVCRDLRWGNVEA